MVLDMRCHGHGFALFKLSIDLNHPVNGKPLSSYITHGDRQSETNVYMVEAFGLSAEFYVLEVAFRLSHKLFQ